MRNPGQMIVVPTLFKVSKNVQMKSQSSFDKKMLVKHLTWHAICSNIVEPQAAQAHYELYVVQCYVI